MALIIPVGFAQVVVEWTLTGDPEGIVITHGIERDSGTDGQTTVNGLFSAWAINTGINNQVSSQYTLSRVSMYQGTTEGIPIIFESANSPQAGGGAGAPLPQNNAVLITKRSAQAGRRNKGRVYVPGIGEGAVDGVGVIQAATVTAWQTAINANDTALRGTAGVSDLVILHAAGATPTPPPTPQTTWVVENRIATQRARLRR